jgi:hypothetical protein
VFQRCQAKQGNANASAGSAWKAEWNSTLYRHHKPSFIGKTTSDLHEYQQIGLQQVFIDFSRNGFDQLVLYLVVHLHCRFQ